MTARRLRSDLRSELIRTFAHENTWEVAWGALRVMDAICYSRASARTVDRIRDEVDAARVFGRFLEQLILRARKEAA